MDLADREVLVATRRALHVVAEHVLLPEMHARTVGIALRVAPDGISTSSYEAADGTRRRLRIEGADVVDERDGHDVARVSLARPTTLRDVRAALRIRDAPPGDIYDLGSPGDPGLVLAVDPGAAALLGDVFAVARRALDVLRTEAEAERAREPDLVGPIALWPESLDLSCSIDRVTYGASAGDDAHPEPYVYVAPWDGAPDGEMWNAPFGASWPAVPVPSVDDVLGHLRSARRALGRP